MGAIGLSQFQLLAVIRNILRSIGVTAVWASMLPAQSSEWRTVHQVASWYSAVIDHAVTPTTSLWFDGQWRRMGIGAKPQQLLLRPGVQYTLTPGVRVAAGYAYVATAPYGEVPSSTPLREHRVWQQLSLSHRAGVLAVSHRYRWEQRWQAPVSAPNTGGASSVGAWRYQQRARYLGRVQSNLPVLRVGGRPVLGFVWDELLLPVGHAGASARLAQNRASVGVGVPMNSRARLDLSYMNLWNALPTSQTNEVNHTIGVSLVWVSNK